MIKNTWGGKRENSGREKIWDSEVARQSSKAKTWNQKIRFQVIEILGGKCLHCGFSDYRALQIDHVNGDSPTDGRVTGSSYFKRVTESVKQNENRYQLLCSNCNWIKRYEKKEFLPITKRNK